jgi:hypothetical protein
MRVKEWLVYRKAIHVRPGCACAEASVTCRKENSGSPTICGLDTHMSGDGRRLSTRCQPDLW